MAIVRLRPPLRDLVGGDGTLRVEGGTVSEVVTRLQRDHPRLIGWVLDERGSVREHVAVFVNGERADAGATLRADDRVDILGAISGGADDSEILVGTR